MFNKTLRSKYLASAFILFTMLICSNFVGEDIPLEDQLQGTVPIILKQHIFTVISLEM